MDLCRLFRPEGECEIGSLSIIRLRATALHASTNSIVPAVLLARSARALHNSLSPSRCMRLFCWPGNASSRYPFPVFGKFPI